MTLDACLETAKTTLTTSLDALGQHLCCAVCLSLPKKPTKLACSHYFCAACAKTLFDRKQPCPTCRAPCTKRESRKDERFEKIVSAYTNVLAAVASVMETEVPYGSQIPATQLRKHNARAPQRRTSVSQLKEIMANMRKLPTLPRAFGDENGGGRRGNGAFEELVGELEEASTATEETVERETRAPWTGAVIDPNAAVQGRHPCAFCKRGSEVGESVERFEEKISRKTVVEHCHTTCALWAPLVVSSVDGGLTNVCAEVRRAKSLKCAYCKKVGAPSGCSESRCKKSYHIWCARLVQGTTYDGEHFSISCPAHSTLPLALLPAQRPATRAPSLKRAQAPTNGKSATKRQKSLVSIDPSDSSYELLKTTRETRVCGSLLSDAEKKELEKFCKQFDFVYESMFSPQTTHVVFGKGKVDSGSMVLRKKSAKFYEALIQGCWILSSAWVKSCLEQQRCVDEDAFEIQGDSCGNLGGPQRARENLGAKVFSTWHFVYLGKFRDSNQLEMNMQFARADGAVVTRIEDIGDSLSPSSPRNSPVVVVVDMAPNKSAHRAPYADVYVPFAKRLPTPAVAIVTLDFVVDSVSSREPKGFGTSAIEALERLAAQDDEAAFDTVTADSSACA